MAQEKLEVQIEQVKDFEFMVKFAPEGVELLMDEPEPLGGGVGPNASKVLSAAVGNCLSASLLFCLRKVRAEPNHLKTKVVTTMTREEKGRLRIGRSEVTITLDMDEEAKQRLGRCLGLFEDYCVVTQSVRNGIDVSVTVQDTNGELIYNSQEEK